MGNVANTVILIAFVAIVAYLVKKAKAAQEEMTVVQNEKHTAQLQSNEERHEKALKEKDEDVKAKLKEKDEDMKAKLKEKDEEMKAKLRCELETFTIAEVADLSPKMLKEYHDLCKECCIPPLQLPADCSTSPSSGET
jgi:hypothetical protein